jgi:periplasmic mercuric ion binding protein
MKLLFTLILASLISISGQAQKTTEKITINTPGVQCETCKTFIENRLSKEYGVSSVKADYKKKTVTVVFIKDRTNAENIKTVLANYGYDAGDVSAEPDARKRLPKNCQHIVSTAK